MGLRFLVSTITPIHIGSGKLINPLDYYFDEKTQQINIISFDKIIAALKDHFGEEDVLHHIDDLSKAVEENVDNTQLTYSIIDYLKEIGINPKVTIDRSLDSVPLEKQKVQINEFITTGRGYFIPGSSVKGAIRTSYLYNKMKESGITIDRSYRLRGKKWAGQELEQRVFGRTPNIDIFRTLSISDSNVFGEKYIQISTIEKTNILTNNPVLNLYMQTCYLMDYEKKRKMGLSLNVKYNQKLHKSLDKNSTNLIDSIVKSANNFSKDIIEHEIDVVKNQVVKQFYQRTLKRLETFTDLKKFILPIGYGTGYLSKTMALLLDPQQLNAIRGKYKIGRAHSSVFPLQRTFITKTAKNIATSLPLPIGWIQITVKEQ